MSVIVEIERKHKTKDYYTDKKTTSYSYRSVSYSNISSTDLTDSYILARKDGTIQTNLNADLLDGYHASAFINSANWKYGRLVSGTDFLNRHIEFSFATALTSVPIFVYLHVFRMRQVSAGWKMYDVLFYHTVEDWYDATGFQLDIGDNETLSGVIVIYDFRI